MNVSETYVNENNNVNENENNENQGYNSLLNQTLKLNNNNNNYNPSESSELVEYNFQHEKKFQEEKKIRDKADKDSVIESWSNKKEEIVKNWIDKLKYYQVIIYFHLFELKKIENSWAWLIIILSAVVSTISVFQFEEDKKNKDLVFALNIIITVMTVSITLIASWMKKQNYVGKISECEKYLESLSSVISELKGQFDILPEDRVKYSIFRKI